MEKISVVIPTRNRHDRLMETLRSLEKNTYKNIEIIIICDQDLDTYNKLMLNGVDKKYSAKLIFTEDNIEWVAGIRLGIQHASGEFFVYGADDIIFKEDCLEKAMKYFIDKFIDGVGLVKLNDLQNPRLALHGLTTKKTIEKFDAFSKDYIHFYADTEFTIRTIMNNRFVFCEDAIAEHVHWANRKAYMDKVYVESLKALERDKQTYLSRNPRNLLTKRLI